MDGDSEALALVKEGGAYKLSIAFAWTLMGYGLGQFGANVHGNVKVSVDGQRKSLLVANRSPHLASVVSAGS